MILNGNIERKLSGWPDRSVTVLLIVLAIVIIVAAIKAPTWLKIVLAAWVIAP